MIGMSDVLGIKKLWAWRPELQTKKCSIPASYSSCILFFIFKEKFMQRRNFIKSTSLASAGLTIINFPLFGKNAPSNKVVVAVMGVNSSGSYLAKCYSQLPNVEVAYICDVEDKAIQN